MTEDWLCLDNYMYEYLNRQFSIHGIGVQANEVDSVGVKNNI